MPNAAKTQQDANRVFPRPKAQPVTVERAGLTQPDASPDTPVSSIWFEAARVAVGKQENQAGEVGKDRANYVRDAKKLCEFLESLGPQFCANFGAGLMDAYGAALETPQQRMRRKLLIARQAIDEVQQGLDYFSEER